ncbi:MAG: hypothetical protein CLLPBCKN_004867 [Chroococcidiopsis cubana SAG 39.79]|nr:hypothetical protein [Chroococcidiopsis cubana SAG 39.79]
MFWRSEEQGATILCVLLSVLASNATLRLRLMRDIKMDLLSTEILTNRLRLKPVSMAYKEEIFSEFTEDITKYMCPRSPNILLK